MTLTVFSIKLNIHQVYLADELYKLLGLGFRFVELLCVDANKGGNAFDNRPYLICSWRSEDERNRAYCYAQLSDVCIFSGIESLPFQKERLKKNLLSFEMSERLLKRGIWNALSPKLLLNQWYYHTQWYNRELYKLCCGAFVAKDQYYLHSFKGRCFKFGYFTKVEQLNILEVKKEKDERIKILWCARFLKWKHPEMMIGLAKRMKQNGIDAEINMIGNGELYEKIQEQIIEHNLSDFIILHGNIPNEDVLKQMKQSDIFVLTSDKQEGWGAVVNEAMGNGCCVVCSDAVGCAPFLIKDGNNGLLFKSKDTESLYERVMYLVMHQEERIRLSQNAYSTISEEWSPKKAAENLVCLAHDLIEGGDTSIEKGPCSKAYPIH